MEREGPFFGNVATVPYLSNKDYSYGYTIFFSQWVPLLEVMFLGGNARTAMTFRVG